jgi:hypothetical protein
MGFLRHQSGSTIEIDKPLDAVFSAVVAAGQEVGKVKEENKIAGYLVIRTPIKWFPPRNPTTVRIALKKQGAGSTLLTFESDCFDGAVGFGSAGKANDMIIKAIERHL